MPKLSTMKKWPGGRARKVIAKRVSTALEGLFSSYFGPRWDRRSDHAEIQSIARELKVAILSSLGGSLATAYAARVNSGASGEMNVDEVINLAERLGAQRK